jgi:hypothetical protein
MPPVFHQYGLSIVFSAIIVLAFSCLGWLVARQCRQAGRPALVPTARTLALGALLLILAATALPYRLPPPGFRGYVPVNLTLGRGGLTDWRAVFEDPVSTRALLFDGNVLLYFPFASFATIGWPHRRATILIGSFILCCLVELVQFEWLSRTAAIDDVVLNMVGAVAGVIVGSAVAARSSALEDGRDHP